MSARGAYDLAVIGGGSAGLTAATAAGRVGARVLLIDKERLGGDCLYYGCVPSKALIHCAKVAHTTRGAARFGVDAGPIHTDFPRALTYVWDTIRTIAEHDSPKAMAAHGVEVAFGAARFLSPTRIEVGGSRVVEARRTIIAVGSHAIAPPIPGLREAGFIDHVKIFHLERLPARVVVVGGGPIGVELGQSLARFGSHVTLLQRGPRLLPRDDAELTELLARALAPELEVRCHADVVRVSTEGGEKIVVYTRNGREEALRCDEILVAVGRSAPLEPLGLDAAGVRIERGLIAVDDHLRTSAANIFACGDCASPLQFTHLAEAQARVAVRNALFRGAQGFLARNIPWVTFSDPELAHVGLTEDEAGALGQPVEVFRYPYDRLDRAVCEGTPHGLAKVVCDQQGRILGASILGPHAGEAISNMVLAMNAGTRVQELSRTIFVYPTMNRIVRRVADERFLSRGLGAWTRRLFARFRGRAAD